MEETRVPCKIHPKCQATGNYRTCHGRDSNNDNGNSLDNPAINFIQKLNCITNPVYVDLECSFENMISS